MTEMEREILPELVSHYLPETIEQTKICKVRSILGEAVKGISDGQLETFVAQYEYLLDCWIDEYERKIFNGKTLKEMIKDS